MTSDEPEEPNTRADWQMLCLAVGVGVVAGLGAVAFRGLIGFFHNLLFLGRLSFEYDANTHTPESPWGLGIVLVPVLGALGVTYMVKHFAPEAKGHGVPEVMDAIFHQKGRIRPVVALVKALASALSIGSGGSVGREGPIIQIGSAFGSSLGQWVRMPVHQRVTLIAAGAGGGIAATFNTPIGGLAFAMELMLPVVRARSVLLVGLATVTATHIGRIFVGDVPSFDVADIRIPADRAMFLVGLLLFVVLGVFVGLLSTVFVRSIYWFEDRFDALPGNAYSRHLLGMSIVGVIIYLFVRNSGHYYVQGVGYATIIDILDGSMTAVGLLALLLAAKLLVTCLTLGSGASGGVFSPALFLGACLGGLFGLGAQSLLGESSPGVGTCAVAGMAGMIGGTTGAAFTAITMAFEMTRDVRAILPIVLVVCIAYAVRSRLSRPNIYTLKLLRRGQVVPEGLVAGLITSRNVCDAMLAAIVDPTAEGEPGDWMSAVVTIDGDGPALLRPSVEGIPCITVHEKDELTEVLYLLRRDGSRLAVVTDASGEVVGVLRDEEIAELARRDAELLR